MSTTVACEAVQMPGHVDPAHVMFDRHAGWRGHPDAGNGDIWRCQIGDRRRVPTPHEPSPIAIPSGPADEPEEYERWDGMA
ncbi:MAG: hypothetical protein JWO31_3100 [Phycisphaerales bacterium]|nr:hypothetical protein [Phycisphaerales bacterium]